MVQIESLQKKISAYAYFLPFYFLTIGTLYLWGYWSKFKINILEYIGLTDIIKLSAYPISTGFFFLLIGLILGEISNPNLPVGAGKKTKIGVFLNKVKPILVIPYFGILFFLLIWDNDYEKWRFLPFLLAYPFYFQAKKHLLLDDLLPDESVRSVILFAAFLLPGYAYGFGRTDAQDILKGTKYQYIVSSFNGLDDRKSNKTEEKYRYVGMVSEYIFLFNPISSSIIIAKSEQIKFIELLSKDK